MLAHETFDEPELLVDIEQTIGEPGRWMGEEISLDDDRAYVREFLNDRVIPRFPQQREGG